ncbi:hypothetical protein N7462_001066 [Penicillium macrosclerotiorum]|uniref:uncharacterized protein n=1 Tax=Penicillium macrosclerotiorum TaxID=303699 RepID=UPI00254672D5|nr:uncharacterized protein N7462_001066 [Penicillium macrosclerotiorum]KAJ5699061.1 hypothetical protein N7462_001066 [Penicillium macrosclerotiorum]
MVSETKDREFPYKNEAKQKTGGEMGGLPQPKVPGIGMTAQPLRAESHCRQQGSRRVTGMRTIEDAVN